MIQNKTILQCGLMSAFVFFAACVVGEDGPPTDPPVDIVNEDIPDEGTQTIHSILQGTIVGLADAPAGISGVASLVRTLDGETRVDVQVAGLAADAEHGVHVHNQPCAQAGGGHYKMDVAVLDTIEENEIWPQFVSDGDGIGRGVATVAHLARGEALSIVVHAPIADGGGKLACADLVAQDNDTMSATGMFAPLPGGDVLDATIVGTAMLARAGTETSVNLSVTGLDPASAYVSHVHALPCEVDAGGGHYKFDPSIEAIDPGNEFQPVLDNAGTAAADAVLTVPDHGARADAQSVVVHRLVLDLPAPKVACANLTREAYPSSTHTGGATLLEAGTAQVPDLEATATIVRRLDGISGITLSATNLEPGGKYNTHVHNAPCDVKNGAGHYKIDPSVTETIEANELWIGLAADDAGEATGTTFANHIARAEAQSLVIHNQVTGDRLACVSIK